MCITSVGSFPVQSEGSLTIFAVPLGVRKLALNRENFLYVSCSQTFGMLVRYMEGW